MISAFRWPAGAERAPIWRARCITTSLRDGHERSVVPSRPGWCVVLVIATAGAPPEIDRGDFHSAQAAAISRCAAIPAGRSLDDCGDAGILLPEHVIHNIAAFRDVIPADFCSR
jgi:hypothetical protein